MNLLNRRWTPPAASSNVSETIRTLEAAAEQPTQGEARTPETNRPQPGHLRVKLQKPAEPASLPTMADLFAPAALDFARDRLTLGDMAGEIVTLVDYPTHVRTAWLARLFNMPGVVASMHMSPTDPALLVKRINSSISEFSARLASGGRNALLSQRTEQSLRDAQALLQLLDQEQQSVFVVVIVLLVLGRDQEEVEQRKHRVEAAAAAAGMRARSLTFLQSEGLTAAGPWAWLPSSVAEIAPRNMPSETVAGALPFVGGTINHGSGVIMGKDAAGGLVIVDRWNPPAGLGAEGPNMVVIARTRAGKSFGVKLLALREFQMGAKLILIDPEREYRDFALRLGGLWVDAAGGSCVINPFQVRPTPADTTEISRHTRLGSPLAAQAQRLRTFFDLYLRDLNDLQRANLEQAILTLYADYGVTWDTDPAEVKEWPTMKALYEMLRNLAKGDPGRWESLAMYLHTAAEGIDSTLWAGETSVPETTDILCLDVHNLNNLAENVRRAQYFNVLTYTWDLIRRDRVNERKLLVVDEAWFLADPKVPASLDFLQQMSKRIAKYRGAIVTVTQNLADFLAPEVARQGEAIVGNATYKWLLRQGERDLEALVKLLNLSEAERDLLAGARRGEGLLIGGNQRVHLRVEAAPHELALIDPEQAAARGLRV